MRRREFIRSVAGATASAGLPNLTFAAPPPEPPNILFVMVDELRFPTVFPAGVAGAADFFRRFMPNVARLWRRGAKFTNHYAAASACTPARGTLLTGLYAHQTWLCGTLLQKPYCEGGLQPPLQPDFPTWGTLLRERGYSTAWAGKWHVSYPAKGLDGLSLYGFDQLTWPDPTGANLQGTYGQPGRGYLNDRLIAKAATDWLLSRNAADKPWCLSVSFVNPHDQQDFWAGTEFKRYAACFAGGALQPITRYSTEDDPPFVAWAEDAVRDPPDYAFPDRAPNWETAPDLARKPTTQRAFRDFMAATWGGITDDPTVSVFGVEPYPGHSRPIIGIGTAPFSYWRRSLDAYTWFCRQVDDRIGEVLNALPDTVAARTIVIFTSDHGEYAGAHGFAAGKTGSVYDEAYRIPLIVVDPTGRFVADADTPRDGLTSSVDVLPMIMSLATGGGRDWMNRDEEALYGRRHDLTSMLMSAEAPGRPYVVYTTDEPIPGYYNPANAPIHITGLRDKGGKLGVYSHWSFGTTTASPFQGSETEFYDYSTTAGRLELASEPKADAAIAMLAQLQLTVMPEELRAPVPATLRTAQRKAERSLRLYLSLAEVSRNPKYQSKKTCKAPAWGSDF